MKTSDIKINKCCEDHTLASDHLPWEGLPVNVGFNNGEDRKSFMRLENSEEFTNFQTISYVALEAKKAKYEERVVIWLEGFVDDAMVAVRTVINNDI